MLEAFRLFKGVGAKRDAQTARRNLSNIMNRQPPPDEVGETLAEAIEAVLGTDKEENRLHRDSPAIARGMGGGGEALDARAVVSGSAAAVSQEPMIPASHSPCDPA